jgi:hypothetical protein
VETPLEKWSMVGIDSPGRVTDQLELEDDQEPFFVILSSPESQGTEEFIQKCLRCYCSQKKSAIKALYG